MCILPNPRYLPESVREVELTFSGRIVQDAHMILEEPYALLFTGTSSHLQKMSVPPADTFILREFTLMAKDIATRLTYKVKTDQFQF